MKIDMKAFLEAQKEVSESKGIRDEDVLNAFIEAVKAAYIRVLGGGAKDMPDPVVTCEIDWKDEENPIHLAQIKKVKDEVEDDVLEIETEEANEGLAEPKYKEGDDYVIPADPDDLSKAFHMAVKSSFRQKLAEAERSALYEIYKDHIGEMMNGTVERADDRAVLVNIGRTNVELSRRELIGDEFFRVGDPIKVYIQKVETAAAPEPGKKPRGPQIEATRASEGFLKRLFEEEIHEIYDGTVVIKAVARKAGVRSKVAVATNNEDVDPSGACIGQGGSRIQKIVSQLGNGKAKEKIDVIAYSENLALFVADACRPAQVLGVKLDEQPDEFNKLHGIAVIKDGDLPLAMGKYKSNIELARKLTGVSIELMEESIALEKGVEYTPVEALRVQEEQNKKEKARQEYLKKTQEEAARRLEEEEARRKAVEEEARRKAEEEAKLAALQEEAAEAKKPSVEPIIPAEAPKTGAKPEEFPAEAANPVAAALAAMKRQAEEEARLAAEKPAEDEPAAESKPVEEPVHKEVKTTTTLSDLEAQLEASKEKKTRSASKKRPRKITEDEVKREVVRPSVSDNAMPVYTEEELAKIEEEEANNGYDADIESDEDIDQDYADYDQYYDEK